MLNQQTVIVRAQKGRHVFVGESVLSETAWTEVPITPSVIKGIRVGDIVEGKPEDAAPARDTKVETKK